MLCKYGCGKEAIYKDRCNKSWNKCSVLIKKNSEALSKAHKEGRATTEGFCGWNKGLTKETDSRIRKAGETLSLRYKKGEIVAPWKGKSLPDLVKKKVSEGMKKAHKEQRAWNIGKSRWNNEASYPEKFFMSVVENEFDDKNYEKEFSVGIYSIDFAWVKKKKAIEIDGSQHERFNDYKERDKRKDKFLEENEWKVLRISWKEMYKDTKKYIKLCKDFIHSDVAELVDALDC